jgi:UDP-4-amino-4-deoxy-L-arabinose formyltransferase/UDP-glucuronic acid dehydrogenase (UDP-4-keto-hexauronic acid decarboxylating)
MRIAILGRTEMLLETAQRLHAAGHEIAVVVTAKEAPEYRATAADFEAAAHALGARFVHTTRIADTLDLMSTLPPLDLAVSCNYPAIVPQKVVDRFRLGVLNAHGGDLPRYRGNACQAWAILHGEERIGLCIHKMVGDELDSGDILARDYFPVSLSTKVTEVWNWMNARIPTLFADSVEKLRYDPGYVLARQSQDPRDALRCYPRRPEDGRIDWKAAAIDVLRLVNASNRPYAGAFCEFAGRRMTVWDSRLVDDGELFLAVPGQVTRIGDGFVDVATGRGKLRLTEVELGGEVAAPDRFVRSIRARLA